MRNPFQAAHPGHKIFAAFAEAAAQRSSDEHPAAWRGREAAAVLEAAIGISSTTGLRTPALEDVTEAQIQAMGHSDYGVTWVCELLKRLRADGGVRHVR